jgi:dTDP-4-amino-4,6-dideoxy-D-galactose acyltransferase
MLNPIEIIPLEWDSAFFGFKVARADLIDCKPELLNHQLLKLKQEGLRLVYAFVHPSDKNSNTSCTDNKGFLVDEKVTYRIEKLINVPTSEHLSKYSDRFPSPQLYNLALISGEYSRFNVDTRIGKDKFISLYNLWIENSVNGKLADEVLVYTNKEEVLGFVSLTVIKPQASIGLIAVDPDYQGLNIGHELVNAAINEALKNNHSSIEVITQKGNAGACRFYERCGFSLASVKNIYHFWL